MSSSGAYLALGALGGYGKGLTQNAAMKMEEYKSQVDFMRHRSLVDLRHQYGVEDTADTREYQAGVLSEKREYDTAALSEKREYDIAALDKANVRKDELRAKKVVGYKNINGVNTPVNAEGLPVLGAPPIDPDIPDFDSSKYKVAQKLVDNDFVQDFLKWRRELPEEDQTIGDFTINDPLTKEVKYDINKMISLAPPDIQAKYKALQKLTEKYESTGKLPPQEALTRAKNEYKTRLIKQQTAIDQKTAKDQTKINQKVIENAAKDLGETSQEIKRIAVAKVTNKNVKGMVQKLLDNPESRDKIIKNLKNINPDLYVAVNEILTDIEKSSPSIMGSPPKYVTAGPSSSSFPGGYLERTTGNYPISGESLTNPKPVGLLGEPTPVQESFGPRRVMGLFTDLDRDFYEQESFGPRREF